MKKVTKAKKECAVKQPQDLYNIYMTKGVPELFLSFGYVGLGEDPLLKDVPVETRNNMFFLCQNLQVVISEAMKSKESRDSRKMLGFLQLAIEESDKFYKNKPDDFLFHQLTPNK